MKRSASFFIVVMMITSAAMAAGEPMAFLKLGVGVRATALGGAYTSVADDASGAFYNPAGITGVKSLQFIAETYILSFGRSVNYVSSCTAFKLGGHYYSTGLSWFNYSAGSDIEVRSTNSTLPEKKISDSSHLVILTVATDISDRLSAGFNAKLDLRGIGSESAAGFGFDGGIKLKISGGLNAGICVSNINAKVLWDKSQYEEPAPGTYSFGLSYGHNDVFGVPRLNVLASVDYVLNTFGFMKIKCGAEIQVNEFFFVRAGFNDALTAGCGLVLKPSNKFAVKFDYAFKVDTIVEDAINHRVGVTLDFMMDEKRKDTLPEAPDKKQDTKSEEPW